MPNKLICLLFIVLIVISCEKKEKPKAVFEIYDATDPYAPGSVAKTFKNFSENAESFKWEITGGDSGNVYIYDYRDVSHTFYSNGLYKAKLTAYDKKEKNESVVEKEFEIKNITGMEYKFTTPNGEIISGFSPVRVILSRIYSIDLQFEMKNYTGYLTFNCHNEYPGQILSLQLNENPRVSEIFIFQLNKDSQPAFFNDALAASGTFKYIDSELTDNNKFKFNAEINAEITGKDVSTLQPVTYKFEGKLSCYTDRPY